MIYFTIILLIDRQTKQDSLHKSPATAIGRSNENVKGLHKCKKSKQEVNATKSNRTS